MTSPDKIDTDYLFQLARDKSSEGRSNLASIIADLFDHQGNSISDRERDLMFNILHGIIHEVEESVRTSLSRRIASFSDAPLELINHLATDEIDVAYPILKKSKVLRDADLIDVIRLRTHEHQLAITLRTDISEDVSDALVEGGDEGVVESLLKNENARISEATMEYLVDQSERIDTYQEPLLHRHDLKEDLAKRMFMWVSAALRHHIIDRYEIDAQVVDDLLEQVATEEAERAATARQEARRSSAKLTAALRDEGMVTAEMLVAALTDGEVPLFLALFTEITGLTEFLAARMVFEEGGEGLAIACRAVGIPEPQFAKIFAMSRRSKPHVAKALKRDLPKVLDLYRKMTQEAAAAVLHRWQRGSDYLAAIRELELGA
jgi:uncharacterized protein (DUF2336 family)